MVYIPNTVSAVFAGPGFPRVFVRFLCCQGEMLNVRTTSPSRALFFSFTLPHLPHLSALGSRTLLDDSNSLGHPRRTAGEATQQTLDVPEDTPTLLRSLLTAGSSDLSRVLHVGQ